MRFFRICFRRKLNSIFTLSDFFSCRTCLIFLQTKISEPFLALCQYQFAIASNNPQSGDAFRKNVQALRSQYLFEFFKIFEYGTYTCIFPFCIKIWKAESLLQTITELSIKELICTGFRKCSTKIGICIFSSARFVKIMFLLAFSELWPYFEFSDWKTVCSFSCSFPMSSSLCRAGVEEVPVGHENHQESIARSFCRCACSRSVPLYLKLVLVCMV